jgi:sugar lactone lactonase YvrE
MNKALFSSILLVLCACSSNASVAPSSPNVAAGLRKSSGPTAYVAEVCQQPSGSCSPAGGLVETLTGQTITDGIADPWSLAFDAQGNLYVGNANDPQSTGTVTVYPAGQTSPSHTIKNLPGNPRALAVDSSGNLYVLGNAKVGCCGIEGFGRVYAPGGTKLIMKLSGVASFPGRPAFDSQGNFYVPNFSVFPGGIAVYAPGAKKPSRVIEQGIGFPKVLAFDASGNLYVLNGTFSNRSNVTVYSPGSSSVLRTLSTGMSDADTMTLDSAGNVYVANERPSGVLVYAAGTTTLTRTIVKGVKFPTGLAFDANGNLLVANNPTHRRTSVTVYAPGAMQPSRKYPLQQSPTVIVSPGPM